MVGDWNVVQDYETETANYRSQNNIKAQRQIIDMKNSLCTLYLEVLFIKIAISLLLSVCELKYPL
jgi:hypothetical protein